MRFFKIRRVLKRDIVHMEDSPEVAAATIAEIDSRFLDNVDALQESGFSYPAMHQLLAFARYAFALFSLSVHAAGDKWVHPPFVAYAPLLVCCEKYPESNRTGTRCTPIPWTNAGLVEAERLYGCAYGLRGQTILTRGIIRRMSPDERLLWEVEWKDALMREGRRLESDGYHEGLDFVLTTGGVVYPSGSRYLTDMEAQHAEVGAFYAKLHSDPELFGEFWPFWKRKNQEQVDCEASFPSDVEFFTGEEWPLTPARTSPSMPAEQAQGGANEG